MKISGPVCPMPDRDGMRVKREDGRPVFTGRHQLKTICDGSGFACAKCSRTFKWVGKELV